MLGIVYIRKLWDMTANDVAEKIGVHRTAITAWERNKHVPTKRLDALSKLFWGLDKEYFSKKLTDVDKLNIQQFKIMKNIDKRLSKYEENAPDEFQNQSEYLYQHEREQKHIFETKKFLNELMRDLVPSAEYDNVSEQEYRLNMYKTIFEAEKAREIREMLKTFLRAYESANKSKMPSDDFEIDLYNAICKKKRKSRETWELMKQMGFVSGEDESEDLI